MHLFSVAIQIHAGHTGADSLVKFKGQYSFFLVKTKKKFPRAHDFCFDHSNHFDKSTKLL